MKYTCLLLLLALTRSLPAEPFYDLLKKYAFDFYAVKGEMEAIAESVKTMYPEPYIVINADDEKIVDVLRRDEVRDTTIYNEKKWMRKTGYNESEIIKIYCFDTLAIVIEDLEKMINASIPSIDLCLKDAVIKENFLKTGIFNSRMMLYKTYQSKLIGIVSVIKNSKDSLFLPNYERLDYLMDLRNWPEWESIMLDIQDFNIDKSSKRFQARYGPGSSKINGLEYIVSNLMPPFKGNAEGPSAFEPILRLTPICYDFSDSKYVKNFQIGLNYYFLEKPPLGIIRYVGMAFTIADISSTEIYHLNVPSFGFVCHLGKYQIGLIRDKNTSDLKLISTMDFQLIPKVF